MGDSTRKTTCRPRLAFPMNDEVPCDRRARLRLRRRCHWTGTHINNSGSLWRRDKHTRI